MKRLLFIVAVLLSIGGLFSQVNVDAQDLPEVGSYTDDARAARINELMSVYRISLSDTEKALVSSRCVMAQKGLLKVRDRLGVVQVERDKTYTSVISGLTGLKIRFENEQIDASTLDLLIVAYQQKQKSFNLATMAYDTTLGDSVLVDCTGDPTGFRAALEGVRSARKTVVGVSSEISELTKASLPTTFDSLKLHLTTKGGSYGE